MVTYEADVYISLNLVGVNKFRFAFLQFNFGLRTLPFFGPYRLKLETIVSRIIHLYFQMKILFKELNSGHILIGRFPA